MHKFFIICLLLLLAIPAGAATVTLAWDPWDGAGTQPDGYRIFVRDAEIPYNYDLPLWDGPETAATVQVDSGSTWSFVVRAFCLSCGDPPGEYESADSEEVSYDATVIVLPINPLATQGFAVIWTEIVQDDPGNAIAGEEQ